MKIFGRWGGGETSCIMVYGKVVDGFTNLVPRFAGYFLEEEDVGPGNYIFAWKSRNGMKIWKIPFHSTLQNLQQKRYKILKMTNRLDTRYIINMLLPI